MVADSNWPLGVDRPADRGQHIHPGIAQGGGRLARQQRLRCAVHTIAEAQSQGRQHALPRRARARQSINEGRRLPQLSYLLEGVAPPSARRRQLIGLSSYAKACFKGLPTERQKLALDVAINTPDIALIVGPPGTGKTQFITTMKQRTSSQTKPTTVLMS